MKKNLKNKKSLNIAMLGHKRIPSREGGIEIVVEELATRMVTGIYFRNVVRMDIKLHFLLYAK